MGREELQLEFVRRCGDPMDKVVCDGGEVEEEWDGIYEDEG